MDGRVLTFTIAAAVLCGLLFGILPALRATRVEAMSAIKEGQAQTVGGRAHSSSVRWIVGVQVALSVVLMIGTGLFIRTFANLMTLDAGFDVKNVLMVETNVHNAGLPEPALAPLTPGDTYPNGTKDAMGNSHGGVMRFLRGTVIG